MRYFILFLALIGTLDLAAQEIIETVYLEKDEGLASRKINHVTRDSKGYFYLVGDNNIQQYDGEKFRKVDLRTLDKNKLKASDITEVILDENLIYLLFGTSPNYFIIASGSLSIESTTKNPTKTNGIKAVSFSETDNGIEKTVQVNGKEYLWTSQYLYRITTSGKKLIDSLPHLDEELKYVNFDKNGNTIAVYSSNRQTMNHIYVLDTLDKLHNYSLLIEDYDTVKDIYSDDLFHKCMFVGHNGIKIYTFKRDGVKFLQTLPGIKKGQFGRIITRVHSFNDHVMFNSESKRHFIYNVPDKNYTEILEDYPFISEQLGNIQLDEASGNCIQIGKNNSDLTDIYLIDIANDQVEHHTVPYDFNNFVFHSSTTLYLAGKDFYKEKGLLASYDTKTKTFKKLLTDLPPIRSIYYKAQQKQYWLSTEQGLFIYDQTLQPLATFSAKEKGEKYIFHDDIVMSSPYLDKLVACTLGGGVYIIDPTSFTILKHISEDESLTNNLVMGAIADDNDYCWISTFNGLNVINPKLEIVKKIYDFDGLPNREFNNQAVAKDGQGDLYFGTINGLCIINPEKVMRWEDSYQLAIDEVHAGNIKLDLDSDEKIIYDSADSLVISYNITDYNTYPYAAPQVHVATNQENNIRTFDNRISISDIQKGTLNLGLIAGQKPIENYSIVIQKDYSSIINLISIILGITFIAGIILWSVIYYIKRKEKEKTEISKKLNELKLASLQGQMNPHFIFNALGSIQYFIQTSNIQQADAYLSDFAVLMRGILDSSKRKMIVLREEVKLLKLYIGLEKTRFEDRFDVHFNIDDKTDLEAMIPPMILQPYIENAINHGLHHLKARKGKLEINFFPDENKHLNVEIIDNGIGREAAAKIRINKAHKSRGMDNITERVQVINSFSNSNIKINIMDLRSDGSPCGTKVLLTFKE